MRRSRVGPIVSWLKRLLVVCVTVLCCVIASGHASAVELSFPQAPLVTPTDADTYYASRTVSAVAPPSATNSDAELNDVARALNNDPDLIYEFVRNNVHFEATFGLQKGALGTLIDRSGNAFDQANLFVQLVRLGGGTARFVYGQATLDGAAFNEWFELTNARAACDFLANGGIPALVNGQSACGSVSGSVTTVVLRHVWAQVQIAGQWYDFDPARKVYQRFAPINLASAMGYSSAAAILSAAGGSSTTVAGAPARTANSPSGAATTTNGYATALISALRADGYDDHLEEVVGGHRLVPFRMPVAGLRQSGLGYATNVATWATEVPDAYRATLRVRVIRAVTSAVLLDRTYFADQIYGRRMAIDRVSAAGTLQTEGGALRIDGLDVATFDVNANNQWPDAGAGNLELTADHPYAANAGSFADETVLRAPAGLSMSVAIIHGWGASSADLAAKLGSERMYDRYTITGQSVQCDFSKPQFENPDASVSIVAAESQAGIQLGYAWLAQFSRASEMQANIALARRQNHHAIGFAATGALGTTCVAHRLKDSRSSNGRWLIAACRWTCVPS